jgi:hypothetical protein
MMLAEITGLLQGCARDAIRENYRRAILEDNVLGKKTASNRVQTFKRLSALYALDPKVLVFRAFRDFWYRAEEGRPLLALLCAGARDPLLRMTAPPVLDAREGEVVTWESLKAAVAEAAPDRFTEITLTAIAKRAHSSWEQSGHLRGRLRKQRSHPVLTPVNTTYGLLLAYLSGSRGQLLFRSFWGRLLDAPEDRLYHMAHEASRLGLMDFKRIGNVVEANFPCLTPAEKESLREQG